MGDELINVLKNLENLAAASPALYRAIVDQINVNTSEDVAQEAPVMVEETQHVQNGQDDHIIESEVHQGYSEVDQDQVVQEEQVAPQMNGTHEVSETDRAV